MKKISVYQFKSYKSWLETLFHRTENRGLMSRICREIDCQRSYLSRVLTTKLQLTPDHAYRISKVLGLSSDEQDYFLLLVDHERSTDTGFRNFLAGRIQKLKASHSEVQQRVQRPQPEQQLESALYFSSWHWTAIHLWCSTPGSHTAESLARKLSLNLGNVQQCLDVLTHIGFLEKTARSYKYKGGAMHLDRKSPLAQWNHSNWRGKALMDAQLAKESSLHFTNVQTMARTDFFRIRDFLLEAIEKSEKIAGPSAPEELAVICMDAFVFE